MIKELPKIGMGTWLVTDKQILRDTIKAGVKAGYKHIDTAQIYNNEYQIGEVLKELGIKEGELYITSKVTPVNYKHVIESTKESLKRLGLKQLDLMLLHAGIGTKDAIDAYKDLIKLREMNLIRFAGVSNYMIDQLEEIKKETGEYPAVNQIVLAPSVRAVKLEEFCKKKNIKLIGYSIMKPYFAPNPFYENSELTTDEKTYIDSLAKKYQKDPGQILNKWALEHDYHIIPKSEKPSRVTSNILINDFKLSNDEMTKLDSFNRFDSNKYQKMVTQDWLAAMGGEEEFKKKLNQGLLFDKNF